MQEKNWQLEVISADRVRSGMEVQILDKDYEVLLCLEAPNNKVALRVKELGVAGDVKEIIVYHHTIIYCRSYDNKLGSLFEGMFNGKH